jgi:hypothetical protein
MPDAEVVVRELKPGPTKMKDHDGHTSVAGSFTLTNSLIEYGVRYSACNDVLAHQETDLRRAWGQYLPGLGFNKPNVYSWYYNNYIQILLDDMPVGDYILSDLSDESAGGIGKVVATWRTPKAKVDLSFVLMPDHNGVFQELKVHDITEPIGSITVKLTGYYWGFGQDQKQSDGFVTTDPEGGNNWALMGNKINDPASGKGSGPCAILVLPDELDSVKFGRPVQMEKFATFSPGQTARIHWVLWTFPDTPNAKALDYMAGDSDNSRKRLLNLFKTTQ